MRAVVTRVKSASVAIAGETVGSIGQGFLILLGIAPEDTAAHCRKLADKLLGLRVFCDENGKMNRSLSDIGGSALVVSQFTLCANYAHGNRPDFLEAEAPERANALYESFSADLRDAGIPVENGRFGADMLVASENDGPVTILLDTDDLM